MSELGKDDAKNIAEILDVVSERVPALLRAIKDAFLSEEAGRSFGKAVGAFYQELVAAGIPAKDAQEMTSAYVVSVQEALSSASKHHTRTSGMDFRARQGTSAEHDGSAEED